MTGGTIATNNPRRWVGAYQDGTGLYKMGHRYYDPTLGRWTQQAPIHNPPRPQILEPLHLRRRRPTNHTDPTGLNAFSDWVSGAAGKTFDLINPLNWLPDTAGQAFIELGGGFTALPDGLQRDMVAAA